MRKLAVFNNISLDGYFCDASGSMAWAKMDNDAEFNAFTTENAQGGGVLLFGRVTYDLMVGFWPTPAAHQMMPEVAESMNTGPKVVFSRSMAKADWNNTTLVRDDMVASVRRMKQEDGPAMVILGSGSIVAQLAAVNLIDEYQVVVNPIALGAGRTMFDGLPQPMSLRCTISRTFKNGKTFLSYAPLR
ncbi:MAG TPA: dihydrofolate reductase family protein [Burkholderiaceae bacterium]